MCYMIKGLNKGKYMSHQTNTELFERAYALIEGPYVGTFVAKAIGRAVEDNDLEELQRLVVKYEAEESVEHFHGKDILEEQTDAY